VVQLLTRVLGDGIRISSGVEPHTPPIYANRAQLEQALVNVVINARDALNGRGSVEIGTRVSERNGQPYTELFVADDGPGIDPGLRERVFEPFYTTKPRGNGAGLGLTLVLSAVERHGGHISVEMSSSGGALFRLFFPPVDDARRSLPVQLHSG
jgi:signal transduction histidine kinase